MAVLGSKAAGQGLPAIMIGGSQTYTPACTMEAYVYVIGGGGGGAQTDAAVSMGNSGGGAGGCAVSLITLLSGVDYTATIGAGGLHRTNDGTGNAGGNSSFSGSNITTMNGLAGSGGVRSSTAAGGAGGAANGGTIMNNTGGAGGLSTTTYPASGGGAVGLWGTGNAAPPAAGGTNYAQPGGNINWDADTYTDPTVAYQHVLNGTPTKSFAYMTPFPMKSAIAGWAGWSTSNGGSSTSYQHLLHELSAGASNSFVGNGGFSYRGGIRLNTSAPFVGGAGLSATATNCIAQAGNSGSGGGAAITQSADISSGGGGTGVIMIFPISMV